MQHRVANYLLLKKNYEDISGVPGALWYQAAITKDTKQTTTDKQTNFFPYKFTGRIAKIALTFE